MLGGTEDPCVGEGRLAEIQEELGRPCPRVQLDHRNAVPARIVFAQLSSRLTWSAGLTFEIETAGMNLEARRAILRRVQGTLGSEEVDGMLRANAERQRRKAEADAERKSKARASRSRRR